MYCTLSFEKGLENAKKKAKKYAGLRDEQFSLVEHYARQHGINNQYPCFHMDLQQSRRNYSGIYLQANLFQQAGHSVYRQKSYEEGVALSGKRFQMISVEN